MPRFHLKSVNCNYLLNYILALLNANGLAKWRERGQTADRQQVSRPTQCCRLIVLLTAFCGILSIYRLDCDSHFFSKYSSIMKYMRFPSCLFAYSSAILCRPRPNHVIDNLICRCSTSLCGIRQIDNSLKRLSAP